MKKVLLGLLVISAVSITSCKKDAETAPVKNLKVNGGPNPEVALTGEIYTWD